MTFLYSPPVVRAIAILSGSYLAYYLWWRATSTLNPESLLFSLLFLAAEIQGAINFLLFAFMAWDVRRRASIQLEQGLRVDVFVPTYNEDLDVLEPTLIGCRAITYPHTTYVLDDGHRPEVAALAARLGCQYLTRSDNRHAKAGNLNAALARTEGEFVAVLDADMVPQPDFLDKTLGYFVDDRVALVQLPQEYYNLDSLQHAARLEESSPWHEQSLFYRAIQPGKNRWNAAFWCGSPSVVRRAALEEIGGVATETVTEDIHTSVRLHARGWKTVYHDETLAFGIAPDSLHAFAVQRLRWAQGTMQLLRSRDNPLIKPGLTLAQRLNYLASMGTYFDAYQKLVFLLTPPIILATGMLPLWVGGWDFLLHWLPYFLLGLLANVVLGRGHFRYVDVERYNLLKLFTFLQASLTLLLPKGLSFKVTPKRADQTVKRREADQLTPHLVLLGLTASSVVLAVANLLWGLTASYSRQDIILVTIFWALANGWILVLGVRSVLARVYRRQSYRFPAYWTATVVAADGFPAIGTVEDLSSGGARFLASSELDYELGSQVDLTFDTPKGRLLAQGEVVHTSLRPEKRLQVGLKLKAMDPSHRERLLEFLFVTLARRQAEMALDARLIPSPARRRSVFPSRAALPEVNVEGSHAFAEAGKETAR